MAGRIPQDFIDELIARADIIDVVGSRVQLKKAGREYKACCPFHDEKTPSFTVSPEKGFYHCFGCGAHGTALGFLMDYERLDFVEAVEELAQLLGLDVPREASAETRSPVAPVLEIMGAAAKLYQQALREHPMAVDYLKGRGIDGERARDFGIGYAPAGWDFLLQRLGDGDDRRRLLQAGGLITAREGGGFYDRFRDRIMFPIRDGRGRTVAFGGRVLGDGEPKYLNSPETAVFHKGRELYGLYEARRATRRLESVLVVEGYLDVVSLACHGVHNAVATLGTATTTEHLKRVFRATPEVVFCFDGDRAGRDAAWRALQNTLAEMREGRQVRFLFLPDGEDPDSLIRSEGAAAFQARLSTALPLSDYLLKELKNRADTTTTEGMARLAELARPLLSQLPPGVYRELLTDRVASEVKIGRDRLAALVGDSAAPAPRPPRRPGAAPAPGRPSLVRRAIQILLHHPAAARQAEVPRGLGNARQRGVSLLQELLALLAQHPELGSAAVLERFRGRSEGPHLEKLLAEELLIGPDAAAQEFADCLLRLAERGRKDRLNELVQKAEAGALSDAEREELRGIRPGSADPEPGSDAGA
ncbi:MAG: DNA primase [Chromatiales bacterium]|nr:MAG: DNA primase [Chromatiales bacterium]